MIRKPTNQSIVISILFLETFFIEYNQENILIPVGTPIRALRIPKKILLSKVIPTVNIWCAQTMHLKNIIIPMA
jgi:hypothetical protein